MFLHLLALFSTVSAQISPSSLAAQLSLTTSTSLPFPTATQANADTVTFLESQWSLSKGRIEDGEDNLQFVANPFPDTPTSAGSGPVLQVTYEAGSFSHDTGGAQLYSLWNTSDGSPFQSMMLAYDVAFDSGYDWVKGGKLPGLRGGPNLTGCDGGSQPNGTDCFSTRLMWRTNGLGEVYAYILRPDNLCGNSNITCNTDFGISIQRGSFTFQSGQWNSVMIFVQLNNPTNRANGNILVYFNGVLAEQEIDLQFRKGSDIDVGGFWLSTFFGGNDSTWATPVTTNTYYRNIQLWGSKSPSTLVGVAVNQASTHHSTLPWHLWLSVAIMALGLELAM